MEKLEKLGEQLLSILTARSFGYALVLGFWVSLASTLITMIMLGQLAGIDHWVPKISHGSVLLAEFFLLFAIVAAISVIMSAKEDQAKEREKQVAAREAAIAERETKLGEREQDVNKQSKLDLLSEFRAKLAGVWELDFRYSSYNEAGDVIEARGVSFARFLLDEKTAKIRLLINVKADDYFESDDVMIEAISIWPVLAPKHLDYFHDLRLVMEETGDVARGPIFVHLDIDYTEDAPIRLSGTWYDLDGTFAKARREYRAAQHRPANGDLSLRGRITYRRLDMPVGYQPERTLPEIDRQRRSLQLVRES